MSNLKRDCGYLRNGLYIEPTAMDGKAKPCCIIKTFGDGRYTHNTIQEQLDAMLDPEYRYANFKDTICYKCTQQEKITPAGPRLNSLQAVEGIEPGKIVFLQVSFSAFCNFKCLYCGPHSSTEWNKDIEEFQRRNIKFGFDEEHLKIQTTAEETFVREREIINELKRLDLLSLQQIGVFGGEPFMTRHLDEFLKLLINKGNPKNMTIQINTNASLFPKENILESLKEFGNVDLRVSGESIGRLAEYIRNGLRWELYNENIKKWQEFSKINSNIEFRLHLAHNVYSINTIQETEDWILKNNLKIYNHFVRGPHYTDVRKILSKDQINECIRRIEKLKTKEIKESLITFLSNDYYNQEALLDFKDFTQKLDLIRGTSLKDVNPELYNWCF
mgnify:CR=1 FL=1